LVKTAAKATRLQSLDVLRGMFLSFAMWQYYSYFSDNWYSEFSSHLHGTAFPVTPGGRFFSILFTPWVSQVYVFLACVNLNLSARTPLAQRQRKWLAYALLMILEGFLVWPKWGDKLTPPAVVMGILTMFIVSALGKIWHWKGVALALVLVCLTYDHWLIPLGDDFESLVQAVSGSETWEYNARLEYFIGTGLLGYLVGIWLRERTLRKIEILIGVSLLGLVPWLLWGQSYYLPTYDIFGNEYRLSRDLLDLSGLWAIILLTVSVFIYLEMRRFSFKFAKPLIWISVHTWVIFAVHRLLYVYLYGPVLEKLADWNVLPRHPHYGFMIGLSYVSCALVWLALQLPLKIYGVNFIYRVRAKLNLNSRA
jgi:hypothetical protein